MNKNKKYITVTIEPVYKQHFTSLLRKHHVSQWALSSSSGSFAGITTLYCLCSQILENRLRVYFFFLYGVRCWTILLWILQFSCNSIALTQYATFLSILLIYVCAMCTLMKQGQHFMLYNHTCSCQPLLGVRFVNLQLRPHFFISVPSSNA